MMLAPKILRNGWGTTGAFFAGCALVFVGERVFTGGLSLAFNGLGYLRYRERRDLYTQGKYPDDEFCFSGQEVEGYVVFSKIHDDVAEVTVVIPQFGLRYNYRNEPVETIDLSFRFKRDIQKVKNLDKLAAN